LLLPAMKRSLIDTRLSFLALRPRRCSGLISLVGVQNPASTSDHVFREHPWRRCHSDFLSVPAEKRDLDKCT
jgi:hypothetical protein